MIIITRHQATETNAILFSTVACAAPLKFATSWQCCVYDIYVTKRILRTVVFQAQVGAISGHHNRRSKSGSVCEEQFLLLHH